MIMIVFYNLLSELHENLKKKIDTMHIMYYIKTGTTISEV